MYAFLAFLSGSLLFSHVWSSDELNTRILAYVAAVLIVMASALLMHLLVRVLAELRRLEATGSRDADAN